ncbi:MAG: tetratricopeptide repeat protein [Pirellulaceae bacterium]
MTDNLEPDAHSIAARIRNQSWIRYAVLSIAVSAAYANSFLVPFTFDDVRNISNNPEIRHLWPRPEESNYLHDRRPVGRHTFALNYWWGRQDVRGYHAVNLAIHLAAACLLMWLVNDAMSNARNSLNWRRAAGPLSLAAALIWALHPLQTQSVTYIVQRFESLAALCLLGTLCLLARGTRASVAWPWLAASLAVHSLGIATKETAGATLWVALLFDRTFLASSWMEVIKRRWLYYVGFLPAIGWFMMKFSTPQNDLGYLSKGIRWWEYFCTQPEVIVHYLRLTLWPDQLCLDYNWPIATNWWTIAACGVPLILLLGASCWAIVRWPWMGFLGMTFFLTLAPSSSIVPIADLAYEHRMYLPLAPLAILAAMGLWIICQRFCRTDVQAARALLTAAGVLALVLGVRTWQRNNDWGNPRRFWESNVAIAPQSYRAQANLASILLAAGETERAVAHLEKSIAIKPTAVALRNLGQIQRDSRKLEPAVESFQQALKLRPSFAPASLDLARIFAQEEKLPRAVAQYEQTLAIKPQSPIDLVERASALDELGSCQARCEKQREAAESFRRAIEAEPRFVAGHLHLAMVSLELGDLKTAAEEAQAVLRLKPGSKAARELLEKIGARTAQQ